MALNIDPFISEMNTKDLYRPNLFKVEFQTKRGKKGPISFESIDEPTFGKQLGAKVTDKILGQSSLARRVSGLYSPGFIDAAKAAFTKGGPGGLQGNFNDPVTSRYFNYEKTIDTMKILPLYVQSINLPGYNIETVDNISSVEVYSTPNNANFSDLTISFLMTSDFEQRGYFLKWMEEVYNPTTRTAGYYDEYVENIVIKLYNRKGNAVSLTEIDDAYPIAVSDLQLSYTGNDELATFDVTFKFKNIGSSEFKDPSVNEFDEFNNFINQSSQLANQF